MRSEYSVRRRRPRAVWAALITGLVICVVLVLGVLLPVLGLIGAADATTVGVLDVPVGQIVASTAITYLVGVVLLVVAGLTRNGPLAWIAAVGAVISVLLGSLWPLVATTFSSITQVQDAVPFVIGLFHQVFG